MLFRLGAATAVESPKNDDYSDEEQEAMKTAAIAGASVAEVIGVTKNKYDGTYSMKI